MDKGSGNERGYGDETVCNRPKSLLFYHSRDVTKL
jgi:hypothetical protein